MFLVNLQGAVIKFPFLKTVAGSALNWDFVAKFILTTFKIEMGLKASAMEISSKGIRGSSRVTRKVEFSQVVPQSVNRRTSVTKPNEYFFCKISNPSSRLDGRIDLFFADGVEIIY